MAGAGDGGGEYHQLDESQRLLLDVMTTQMQRLLNRNNEEPYGQIEGQEHQMNQNVGRPYGENRRGNNGSRQNIMEWQNRIEGVKLSIPPFKGKSDPNAYLDQEMKIEHVFSCNDYTEEQKVKLAAAKFSYYAIFWWNKNQREMMREKGWEIDTWNEMRRVMQKRYVPTSYNRTMRQKRKLVRANIEEETEDTMAHFQSGLNPEVRDVVELQEYVELDDLLHMAV